MNPGNELTAKIMTLSNATLITNCELKMIISLHVFTKTTPLPINVDKVKILLTTLFSWLHFSHKAYINIFSFALIYISQNVGLGDILLYQLYKLTSSA